MLFGFIIIIISILLSSFFSSAEISLAASRHIKLKQLADEGNEKAKQVLALQGKPGNFFTVVQIGINAAAIFAGIVGEAHLAHRFAVHFEPFLLPETAFRVAQVVSFVLVTVLFILFADLIPKRISMMTPEKVALFVVRPMRFCLALFRPFVFVLNGTANLFFRLFGIPIEVKENITSDDVYAMVEAGAMAGVLGKQEHELIENVFELDSRSVSSIMTVREQITWFDERDTQEIMRQKVERDTHSQYLVCKGEIDVILGYVDSKDLLTAVLNGRDFNIKEKSNLYSPLVIPDTLSISDALKSFRGSKENIAAIVNEYGLVVGIITLKDILAALMGDSLNTGIEDQVVKRDDNSWLVEGATAIADVMRALNIDEFPNSANFETIGGFMMYTLRRIPKRTDFIMHAGYKFEVVDIDSNKVDQILVTKKVDQV